MIRPVFGAVVGIFLVGAAVYVFFTPAPSATPPELITEHTVFLAEVPLRVAIVDTEALRTRGLSGYAPLGRNQGMLFVFAEEGLYSFWMKDMLFSIDILWLDATGAVAHIEEHVSPTSYPASFTPDSPAQYVLEVPAGFAAEHKIVVGSKLTNFPSEK